MSEQEVFEKLRDKGPTGYRLNELIPFSYPVRKLRLDLLVNKEPDGSLIKVYSVLLRAIKAGLETQDKLFEFLGLSSSDEFILRELFQLREKGYVDLIAEKWMLTPEGERFIQDEKILRVEEEEEFEFLIDAISGDLFSSKENHTERVKLEKSLNPEIINPIKSPELLENKFQSLADIYKVDSVGKSYLISYSSNNIKRDYSEWCNYWLVEYIPERNNGLEPRLEVREFQNLKLKKVLTSKFNSEYRHYIYALTNSERNEFEVLAEVIEEAPIVDEPVQTDSADFKTLSIWETKQKFVEALQTVKERILIESPWIKRATHEYLPLFEQLLKDKKQLVILYGIEEKDEHDRVTLQKVEALQTQFPKLFTLIHLPTHFSEIGSRLTGTHRKLLIKDYDYFISGSFNFLSFGKNEQQQVANEESILIKKGVKEKWERIIREYSIS